MELGELFVFGAFALQAQVAISGTVVNKQGAAIADAFLTLQPNGLNTTTVDRRWVVLSMPMVF